MADTRVVVIGGGIAGVSAAWALLEAPDPPDVVLVEAESQLAHHTTGRSAAQLIENYGAGPVRPLTAASLDFLRSPPDDLVDAPLLRPRSLLMVATPHQDPVVEATLAGDPGTIPTIVEITPHEAVERCPAVADRTDPSCGARARFVGHRRGGVAPGVRAGYPSAGR